MFGERKTTANIDAHRYYPWDAFLHSDLRSSKYEMGLDEIM